MTGTLRIGTRGSALALVQANWVAARLAEHGIATEIAIIRTEGDDRPVTRPGARAPSWAGSWRRCSTGRWTSPSTPRRTFPPRSRPARHRRLPAARGSARRARLPGSRDDARRRCRGRPRRHGQPAPRRVPARRPAGPGAPPAPRQRGHAPRQARPRRDRRARPGGGRPDAARPRRPDRRDPAVVGRSRPRPGQGSLALQVRADDAEARGRRASWTTPRPGSPSRPSERCSPAPAAAAGPRSARIGTVDGERLSCRRRRARVGAGAGRGASRPARGLGPRAGAPGGPARAGRPPRARGSSRSGPGPASWSPARPRGRAAWSTASRPRARGGPRPDDRDLPGARGRGPRPARRRRPRRRHRGGRQRQAARATLDAVAVLARTRRAPLGRGGRGDRRRLLEAGASRLVPPGGRRRGAGRRAAVWPGDRVLLPRADIAEPGRATLAGAAP